MAEENINVDEHREYSFVPVKKKKKKISLGRECCAYGCSSTFYNSDGLATGLHFFKFPQKNPEKQLWCNLIKRQDGKDDFQVNLNTCLCYKHFLESDIRKTMNQWRLIKGVVPSQYLYSVHSTARKPRKEPKSRSNFHFKKKLNFSSTNTNSVSDDLLNVSSCSNIVEEPKFKSIEVQTDFSYVHAPIYFPSEAEVIVNQDHSYSVLPTVCNELAAVSMSFGHFEKKVNMQFQQINRLKLKVTELEEYIEKLKAPQFSLEKIKDDDSAVRFYTGFPNFSSLFAVFQYFRPKFEHVHYWQGPKSGNKKDLFYQSQLNSTKPGPKRKLALIDEFFLVLVRLKVGLFLGDLSDRFCISTGLLSKIFTTWINFLYLELPLLFPFPSQTLIRKQMPKQFKAYPTTRIIIDGTEIFIEVPSSMKSQSQTWSQYKHHNTWKALVGISPNGLVTFVSKLWSGRVTDKMLTKESGLLDMLDYGDNVMADRGFDIADILPDGVLLNIPPFKGSRPQLTAEETEDTVRIAAVRIHVERANLTLQF